MQVLDIDEQFYMAFATSRMKRTLRQLEELPMAPGLSVHSVSLQSIGMFAMVVTMICVIVPVLITPQVGNSVFMPMHICNIFIFIYAIVYIAQVCICLYAGQSTPGGKRRTLRRRS